MKLGTIVENKLTAQQGVVVRDTWNCCLPTEVPVVYFGTNTFLGTEINDLEEVGVYDVKPDLHKCGAGKDDDCCIFLTAGPKGPCCERFSSLRDTLIMKKMNAKRNPIEAYPECMNQGTTP